MRGSLLESRFEMHPVIALAVVGVIAVVHGFFHSRATRKEAAQEAAKQTERQVYPLLYEIGILRGKRK